MNKFLKQQIKRNLIVKPFKIGLFLKASSRYSSELELDMAHGLCILTESVFIFVQEGVRCMTGKYVYIARQVLLIFLPCFDFIPDLLRLLASFIANHLVLFID